MPRRRPPNYYWLDDRTLRRVADDDVGDWDYVPPADPIDLSRIVWARLIDREAPEPTPEALLDMAATLRGQRMFLDLLTEELHDRLRRIEARRRYIDQLRDRAWRAYGLTVERTAYSPQMLGDYWATGWR